jgi:hypothetical protein
MFACIPLVSRFWFGFPGLVFKLKVLVAFGASHTGVFSRWIFIVTFGFVGYNLGADYTV